MEVTQDEYELPVAIADNAHQLAIMRNVSVNTIYSAISHEKSGAYKRSRYKRIVIDEED